MHAIAANAVLAAGSIGHVDPSHALIVTVVLGAVLLVGILELVALISIIVAPQPVGMKLVWVIVVFMAPFLGSLLWFFFGRGYARRSAEQYAVRNV